MATEDTVIAVHGVSKNFKLPHQQLNSVKGMFLNMLSLGNATYEVQHALKGINFEVERGEFFGIVGRNGSGKSTMLKILAGIYQPSKGTVEVRGRLVPFIELGVGFNGELSGRENVYLNGALLGFSREEVDAKYEAIVAFSEIGRFMDQKLKNYSSGMQVRLAFSIATVLAESDILLIDEVLAVGDADFQRKCFRYFKQLKKENKTVVFVTHDMNAVREYCDRAILIEKQEIIAAGTADQIAKQYERLLQPKDSQQEGDSSAKKWGDGTLEISRPHVAIQDSNSALDVTYTVTAKQACADMVLGFAVANAAGTVLFGTNTRIENRKVPQLAPGEHLDVHFSMPNILADGAYTVTIAAQYDGGSTTAAWWEEAASFTVVKDKHVPYSIQPDVSVRIKAVTK